MDYFKPKIKFEELDKRCPEVKKPVEEIMKLDIDQLRWMFYTTIGVLLLNPLTGEYNRKSIVEDMPNMKEIGAGQILIAQFMFVNPEEVNRLEEKIAMLPSFYDKKD